MRCAGRPPSLEPRRDKDGRGWTVKTKIVSRCAGAVAARIRQAVCDAELAVRIRRANPRLESFVAFRVQHEVSA